MWRSHLHVESFPFLFFSPSSSFLFIQKLSPHAQSKTTAACAGADAVIHLLPGYFIWRARHRAGSSSRAYPPPRHPPDAKNDPCPVSVVPETRRYQEQCPVGPPPSAKEGGVAQFMSSQNTAAKLFSFRTTTPAARGSTPAPCVSLWTSSKMRPAKPFRVLHRN